MLSEARQKKIMEKLNRAQKCSILGPKKPRVRGGPGPRAPPPDPHLWGLPRSDVRRRQVSGILRDLSLGYPSSLPCDLSHDTFDVTYLTYGQPV